MYFLLEFRWISSQLYVICWFTRGYFTLFGSIWAPASPHFSIFLSAKVSAPKFMKLISSPLGNCATLRYLHRVNFREPPIQSIPSLPPSQRSRASHLSKTNNLRPNSKSAALAKSKPRSLATVFEMFGKFFWRIFSLRVFLMHQIKLDLILPPILTYDSSTFLRFNEICGTHQQNLTSDVHTLVWILWQHLDTLSIQPHLRRNTVEKLRFIYLSVYNPSSINPWSRILVRHDIINHSPKILWPNSRTLKRRCQFLGGHDVVWENHPPGNSWKMEWKKHVVKYRHCHPQKKQQLLSSFALYIYI